MHPAWQRPLRGDALTSFLWTSTLPRLGPWSGAGEIVFSRCVSEKEARYPQLWKTLVFTL